MENRPKNCIDCDIPVTRRAKRCYSCQNRTRIGILNSNYGKKHKGLNKGKNNPMFGRPTPHGNWTNYKNINFRSPWEANFAKFLDGSGIKWQYEPRTFDLGDTTYTPDFYLSEFDCYIEVKGFWRNDAKEKFNMFQSKFNDINIQVFEANELKLIGII